MDAIEIPEVNAICLQNAVLCAECEVISDSPHDTCRVCGSRSLMSLSCVIMCSDRSVRICGSSRPNGATYGAYFAGSSCGNVISHGGSLVF